VHLHPVRARLLHVDGGVLARGLRRLADWIDLSHLDHLCLLVPLGLRRTVAAARQALILVVRVGLRAVVLLVLAVEYLLLILFERSIAGGVDLVRHERLNVGAHWLGHSVHVLLRSELVLVGVAR